jgi:hypothetical protein
VLNSTWNSSINYYPLLRHHLSILDVVVNLIFNLVKYFIFYACNEIISSRLYTIGRLSAHFSKDSFRKTQSIQAVKEFN